MQDKLYLTGLTFLCWVDTDEAIEFSIRVEMKMQILYIDSRGWNALQDRTIWKTKHDYMYAFYDAGSKTNM